MREGGRRELIGPVSYRPSLVFTGLQCYKDAGKREDTAKGSAVALGGRGAR